jgi:hypothetical protein
LHRARKPTLAQRTHYREATTAAHHPDQMKRPGDKRSASRPSQPASRSAAQAWSGAVAELYLAHDSPAPEREPDWLPRRTARSA